MRWDPFNLDTVPSLGLALLGGERGAGHTSGPDSSLLGLDSHPQAWLGTALAFSGLGHPQPILSPTQLQAGLPYTHPQSALILSLFLLNPALSLGCAE